MFGKVRFWRHTFTAPGHEGLCPLDAELSVPAHGYSDRLREWAVDGTTDESSRESQTVLERILGVSLSLQPLETGVAEAMSCLAQRVAQRDGTHRQQRVTRTDGAEALPQQVMAYVPAYTVILDVMHATESRWDTVNALLGETHPQRTAWGRAYLEPLLAGQIEAVITGLEAEGKAPTCPVTPRQAVRRTVGSNGHGDREWPFHRHHHHQRLYGRSTSALALAEDRALEWAA